MTKTRSGLDWPRRNRADIRAFTIAELSVAILIVGLLATILLTAVSKTRESAAAAACVNNLRQLGAAFRMYVNENNGTPPPATYTSDHPASEGHSGSGIRLLRQYHRPGPEYAWTASHKFIRDPLEICPATKINKLSKNLTNGPDYGLYSGAFNYLTYFNKPSQTPMIWDAWDGNWKPTDTLPLRHAAAINCAFLDGHVESLRANDERMFHRWWYNAVTLPEPNAIYLGDGNPLGSTKLP